MPKKIGLQRDSISSLGNNLFGFVLGSALAIVGVLAHDERITGDIVSGNAICKIARLLPLLGVIVLVLYYLLDWYDLNLAIYIDEFVGRYQVTLYVLAAVFTASLPPLVLSGKTNIAAFIAAFYFPLADLQRNRLLEDGLQHLGNTDEAVRYGQKMLIISILRWTLRVLALTLVILAVYSLFAKTSSASLLVAISLVLLWIVAYALKLLRSTFFLQPEYERRINTAPAKAEFRVGAQGADRKEDDGDSAGVAQ